RHASRSAPAGTSTPSCSPDRCGGQPARTVGPAHGKCEGRTPSRGVRPSCAVPYRLLVTCGRTYRLLADQAAQHVLHDAAVAVVVRLTGGVDADHRVELTAYIVGFAGGGVRRHLHRTRRGAVVQLGDTGDGEGLLTG